MIVPVIAISNLVLTRQIYSEETNGAHAHYREPVPLNYCFLLSRFHIWPANLNETPGMRHCLVFAHFLCLVDTRCITEKKAGDNKKNFLLIALSIALLSSLSPDRQIMKKYVEKFIYLYLFILYPYINSYNCLSYSLKFVLYSITYLSSRTVLTFYFLLLYCLL